MVWFLAFSMFRGSENSGNQKSHFRVNWIFSLVCFPVPIPNFFTHCLITFNIAYMLVFLITFEFPTARYVYDFSIIGPWGAWQICSFHIMKIHRLQTCKSSMYTVNCCFKFHGQFHLIQWHYILIKIIFLCYVIDRLINWLIDRLVDRLIDWLIDWLILILTWQLYFFDLTIRNWLDILYLFDNWHDNYAIIMALCVDQNKDLIEENNFDQNIMPYYVMKVNVSCLRMYATPTHLVNTSWHGLPILSWYHE